MQRLDLLLALHSVCSALLVRRTWSPKIKSELWVCTKIWKPGSIGSSTAVKKDKGTGRARHSRTAHADSSIVTMEETQLRRGRVAMRVAMAVLAVLLVCQAFSSKARGLDERCGLFL